MKIDIHRFKDWVEIPYNVNAVYILICGDELSRNYLDQEIRVNKSCAQKKVGFTSFQDCSN